MSSGRMAQTRALGRVAKELESASRQLVSTLLNLAQTPYLIFDRCSFVTRPNARVCTMESLMIHTAFFVRKLPIPSTI
jgi:hypothetical protein